MKKMKPLYEGKAKILWETDDPALMVQEFKNDATAFDGTKHEVVAEKGKLNNAISSHLFGLLSNEGVRTHFVEKLSETEMVVERLRMLPVEVVVRNVAAGSLVRRLGVEEGKCFVADSLRGCRLAATEASPEGWELGDIGEELAERSADIESLRHAIGELRREIEMLQRQARGQA